MAGHPPAWNLSRVGDAELVAFRILYHGPRDARCRSFLIHDALLAERFVGHCGRVMSESSIDVLTRVSSPRA
jgi:hypothetical protein